MKDFVLCFPASVSFRPDDHIFFITVALSSFLKFDVCLG